MKKNDTYIKLHHRNFTTFLNLTNSGRKLFYIVILSLNSPIRDKNTIYLSFASAEECAQNLGFALFKTDYYKGLREILKGSILKKTSERYLYKVNTDYI